MIIPKNKDTEEFQKDENGEILKDENGNELKVPYWNTSHLPKSPYENSHNVFWKEYEKGVTISEPILYTLDKTYDPAKINNTVICYVNDKHMYTKTFNFGTAVAQGAEYDASLTLVHAINKEGKWEEDTSKNYEKKCWYASEFSNEDNQFLFRLNIRNKLGAIINNNVKVTWKFLHWLGNYYDSKEEKNIPFYYHSKDLPLEELNKDNLYGFTIKEIFNFDK
jgi:hypothetical protein